MEEKKKPDLMKMVMAVLVIGALCGFSEVFVSNLLREIGFPFRAGLLTGIGMGLIAIVIAIFKKPFLAIGIAVVAIIAKQMIVPVMGVGISCKLNSCLAVGLEYGALAIIGAFTISAMNKSVKSRIMTAAGAGLASAPVFWVIGMNLAPCRYLMSFAGLSGLGFFMLREGLSWAVFSAVLFPIGWLVGERIREHSLDFMRAKPAFYYGLTASLTIALFVITGWLYSIGH